MWPIPAPPPQILITPPSFVADKLAGQSRNQKSNKEASKDGDSDSAKSEGGDKENSQVAQATVAQAPPVATGSIGEVSAPAVVVNTQYVAAQNISSTTSGSAVLTETVNMAAVPSIAVVTYSNNGNSNVTWSMGAVSPNTLNASSGALVSYSNTSGLGTYSGQAGVSFADKGGQ